METGAIVGIILGGFLVFILFVWAVSAASGGNEEDEEPNRETVYNNDSEPKDEETNVDDFEQESKTEEIKTPKRFCTFCGEALFGNPNFCPHCGTKNESYTEAEKSNSSDKSVVVSVQQTNNGSESKTPIRCPKCGSTNIHFITSQGGQRIDKGDACCGFLACGPLGLLCGVKDEDTTTVRKCMNCNNEF